MTRRMVLDVESVGLHGEGLAYAVVILDRDAVVEEAIAIANPDNCAGERRDFEWLEANVFPWIGRMGGLEFPREGERSLVMSDPTTGALLTLCDSPVSLREAFWSLWVREKQRGTELWADVCWPVESGFLSSCVRARPGRKFEGPYPLRDVATLWDFHVGGSLPRLPEELPEHHPLMDARHSARKLRLIEERTGERRLA